MKKFQTESGGIITADTRGAAEALAAQYGMGRIVGPAAEPKAAKKAAPATKSAKKAARPMTFKEAVRVIAAAYEWPRCGQGWPATEQEEEADRILLAKTDLASFGGDIEEARATIAAWAAWNK